MPFAWDYLIVTASNDAQASAYEAQLSVRRKLGLLTGIREALVVPDPGGKRVGSGGSTVHCLKRVLARETGGLKPAPASEEVFRRLRILIIHAGGDSKRLPAYGPCGKISVPVPGEPITKGSSPLGTITPPPRHAGTRSGKSVVISIASRIRCGSRIASSSRRPT